MKILHFALILLCLTGVGCGFGSTEKYEMNQMIEMGPFVFEIDDATKGDFPQNRSRKQIIVSVLLDQSKSESTEVQFKNFLRGDLNPNAWVLDPPMEIVDGHGNRFIPLNVRHIGGNTYSVQFPLTVDWKVSIKEIYGPIRPPTSAEKKAREEALAYYASLQVQDLQLEIKNLDPRKGQPRHVTIQLQ